MEYRPLGRTGLKVSRLALGCMSYGDPGWRPWVLDEAAAQPFFRRAFEAGINFFDTADMYSMGASEEVLGRAVKRYASNRDAVVIATKVYFPMSRDPNDRGLSRKHILAGIEASLRRLGTDYIDLYQIHRFDHGTPIEETLDALDSLVRAGKVRYLGASSMFAWQFATMLARQDASGYARFVTMQNHYNLIYREEEREMMPLCRARGVALLPWSPLARGVLTRPRSAKAAGDTERARSDDISDRLYHRPDDQAVIDALAALAARRGVPMAQLGLAWLMAKPEVAAPLVGATKIAQLEDALAATRLCLESDELAALEAPYQPHGIAGHD